MYPATAFSKKIILPFLILLGVSAGGALAQTNPLGALQTRVTQYHQGVLQEKIFVHTDKNLYLAGEICWFKLYNVEATSHQPLQVSKVAYLEILDQAQQPVLQTTIALDKGTGQGSMFLPVTLTSGNYLVRAYTNWMKNFSPDFYFHQEITVVNTLSETEIITPPAPVTALDIQFFPEGGQLVPEVPGKVGFRALDPQGQGVDLAGDIVDENEAVVTAFKTSRFGIGSFTFTPVAGKTYQARITLPAGKILRQNLPPVAGQGYGMQVSKNAAGQISVQVATHQISGPAIYLLAHTRHEVKIAQLATLQNNQATFVFEENQLGEGISHLTLFNQDQKPVAERLYFKRPSTKLNIQATTDKISYTPRQPVKLSVSTQTTTGSPAPADLSVSVFRSDMPVIDGTDIYNYLFLTSDLSGSVESPGYYFNSSNAETDAALDNLMLTQGWRRFRWNEVLQEPLPAFQFLPEYEGPVITATVKRIKTGLPAAQVPAYLAVPGKTGQLYPAVSNDQGQLTFFTRGFTGSRDIVLQTQSATDSLFSLTVATPFSGIFSARPFAPYSLPESIWQGLLPQSIGMQAQNLYVPEKMALFKSPTPDSSAFYGKPYKRYTLNNYTRFPSVEEVLREFVGEVAVRKQSSNYVIKVLDLANQDYFENSLVLLDGVPILGSQNKFVRYDGRKIEKLEVIPEKYILGNQTFNGIASFTTYQGNLDGYELNPQALVVNYESLQVQREFYAPLYESAAQVKSRIPDFRNLLHWAPEVKTGKNGNTQLNFYTSDQVGKYIIMIQGLTPKGESGSKTFSIEVK